VTRVASVAQRAAVPHAPHLAAALQACQGRTLADLVHVFQLRKLLPGLPRFQVKSVCGHGVGFLESKPQSPGYGSDDILRQSMRVCDVVRARGRENVH
jgi:hypothetical protein